MIQRRKPKLKDIELIAMNLTAEYISIYIECQLLREISIDLKNKIERSVYNRRKRKLFFEMEFIRTELSRSNSSKFAKKNFIAHQTEVFVQAKTCTIMVTKFMQFVLFKVYLKDIKEPFNNCVILADKGYLSADYQLYLFESKQIKLEVPMRKN